VAGFWETAQGQKNPTSCISQFCGWKPAWQQHHLRPPPKNVDNGIYEHGQLGIALTFPPIDVGGGNFNTVLEVAYVGKDKLHE
jgi:hypothetical protein